MQFKMEHEAWDMLEIDIFWKNTVCQVLLNKEKQSNCFQMVAFAVTIFLTTCVIIVLETDEVQWCNL